MKPKIKVIVHYEDNILQGVYSNSTDVDVVVVDIDDNAEEPVVINENQPPEKLESVDDLFDNGEHLYKEAADRLRKWYNEDGMVEPKFYCEGLNQRYHDNELEDVNHITVDMDDLVITLYSDDGNIIGTYKYIPETERDAFYRDKNVLYNMGHR